MRSAQSTPSPTTSVHRLCGWGGIGASRLLTWQDVALRQHAVLAAFHALHHDPCAATGVAMEQRLVIAGLLREVLLQ